MRKHSTVPPRRRSASRSAELYGELLEQESKARNSFDEMKAERDALEKLVEMLRYILNDTNMLDGYRAKDARDFLNHFLEQTEPTDGGE